MIDKKFAMLVEKLYNKTIDGDIEWEKTDIEGVFQASFPNYSIRLSTEKIHYQEDDTITEYYYFNIYNSEGKLIESTDNYQLSDSLEDSYDKMEKMYHIARRRSLGVEKAIDDLLSELDDDLPF